ncbi:MAG TPA: DUF6498-containing protein [Candidatus Thermoplasmatota archaeon]|nr:DUF6498-containing protein [Candidatus Thermoplasmatota archaeon]
MADPQAARRIEAASLIAANLLPLLGLVLLRWDIGTLLLLYWAETAVIGLATIVEAGVRTHGKALLALPFFLVHAGMFMGVHAVFLTVLFLGGSPSAVLQRLPGVLLPLLLVAASHAVGVVVHLRQARDVKVGQLVTAFYSRIVLMQFAIIGGGFVLVSLGTPLGSGLILVGGKAALEAFAWLRRKAKDDAAAAPTPA